MKLELKGLSCQHCINAVKAALEGINAKNIKVDLNSAEFDDADLEEAKKVITEEGYEVISVTDN